MRADAIISIVMPLRNAAGTVAAALDSIRSQTFQDWELLAVDDGSTDDSGKILEAAAGKDTRIKIVRQPSRGITAALQAGCGQADAEFVARMDADDWMAPERLGQQLQFLRAHPDIGVVSCRVRHGGSEQTQAGYADHVAWINSLQTPEQIALKRFVESPVAHPSVVFRRALLEQHGGYRAGDFPEDYELWLRWMEAGVRFAKVDAELLVWNDLPARLSRTEARYATESFYRVKCHYLARWLRQTLGPGQQVWLWGAGRVTRQRFRHLEAEGTTITGFIDVDPKKWGRMRDGRHVLGPNEVPSQDTTFIVAGVASRGARALIANELDSRGRAEGRDYLLAA